MRPIILPAVNRAAGVVALQSVASCNSLVGGRTMQVEGAVALVTGANRGLGRAFARALLDAGAAKVYAGARDPGTVVDPGVVPLRLDVTDPAQVAAAAAEADDVTIVINNAGIALDAPLLGDDVQ